MGVKVSVTVRLDRSRVSSLVAETSSASAKRAAEKTKGRVQSNIRAAGRVDTGRMLNSIKVTAGTTNGPISDYYVSSDEEYTRYQEDGIGPQRARPGGFLVFKPKGSGTFVFAKQTKGFKGAHFFRDAYAKLTLADFLA